MNRILSILLCGVMMIVFVACTDKQAQEAQYNDYIRKADSCYMVQDFALAKDMFTKAFALDVTPAGNHLSNAASVSALAGDADAAFGFLWRRAELDKDWYSEYVPQDRDLQTLHADPRWQTLLDTLATRQARIEANFDQPLRKRLQEISRADQNIRYQFIMAMQEQPVDSAKLMNLQQEMQRTDSLNTAEICKILDTRGWVGKDKVGEACATFWLVIQHANTELQKKYLPIFQEGAASGELSKEQVAMMEDRINVNEGKPQKYGSQIIQDPETGKFIVAPLLDESKVDEWRKEVGMPPLAEYVKRWDIVL